MKYHYMFYQETTINRVSMICLNPVTTGKDCVNRGLFLTDNYLYNQLTHRNFKKILLTNATTDDGEYDVATYFQVQKQWDELLFQWKEEEKVIIGFEWYYKLLFLVKSTSQVDHIWFSFFEDMHPHAAVVAGLVCSKFNHSTNELKPGSLTLEDFRNGSIKSFKEPGNIVSDHLNQIMSIFFDAPMFENPFYLSAYVPKQNMNAADLIEATLLQSVWISNFKKSLVDTSISKVLARWFKNTLHHSTKETRTTPSYRPALENGHNMYYQEFCTIKSYKEKIHEFEGKDMIPYGYPNCLTGEAWDAYANNPFDLITKKEFLSTISLRCIDKKKKTKMTPPYALALENVTTEVGPISSHGERKIDARHYNGFLLTPGIVYNMTSKIQNSILNDHYGNSFKVGIINFITQFGNYMQNTPYLKIHGA
jgi:hypothetical protein